MQILFNIVGMTSRRQPNRFHSGSADMVLLTNPLKWILHPNFFMPALQPLDATRWMYATLNILSSLGIGPLLHDILKLKMPRSGKQPFGCEHSAKQFVPIASRGRRNAREIPQNLYPINATIPAKSSPNGRSFFRLNTNCFLVS